MPVVRSFQARRCFHSAAPRLSGLAGGKWMFRRALGANVAIVPHAYFPYPYLHFRMESEPLPVHDKPHVRAHLAIGPQVERLIYDQIPHAIIPLDEPRHLRRRLRRRHIFFRLRRRREKSHPRHVL